jgi:hypothetical protein
VGTDRTIAADAKPRRKKYPRRLPAAKRFALNGILFIPKTGIRWRDSDKIGIGLGFNVLERLRE